MSLLPLRIRAEKYAAQKLGEKQAFILPSQHENEVCLIIHDCGLVGVVASSQEYVSTQKLCFMLGIKDSTSLPKYSLIIDESLDTAASSSGSSGNRSGIWIETITGADASTVDKQALITSAVCSQDSSKVIVEAIERYYGRQVLEPSIRGFLSILEKQFPSNNLYLFELLQNAVDDGASIVKFKAIDRGIVFMHDGREFTAMDVLGLASVGLSTKSADKRSVGFMGIGFKAVYKRFAKVVIYDSKWRFCFQEPSEKSTIKPAHAWVMEPRWISEQPTSALSSNDGDDERKWCHFELQQPRVPIKAVHEDLRKIPHSIPPLLGKQAMKNFALESKTSKSSWTLEWNRRKFVTHIVADSSDSNGNSNSNGGSVGADSIGFQTVIVSEYAQGSSQLVEEKYWQFINLSFVPSTSAQAAYLTHTKKSWSSVGDKSRREETSFFFQVDKQGLVIANQTGNVHSILPTKVKLPTSMSWQGSWLLSVDRQEIIFDQEWNKCIASKAGPLLLGLLRWISTQSFAESSLYSSYSMLPTIFKESSSYHIMLLGVKTDVSNLLTSMKREELVPCSPGSSPCHVSYSRASDVCWLPPPFLNRLPSALLSSWFGMKIFASGTLKELAWSPLFTASLVTVTQSLLYRCKKMFKVDKSLLLGSKSVLQTAVSLLCAVSECLNTYPPSMNKDKNNDIKEGEKSEKSENFTDTLLQPDFEFWPIFLGDDENSTLRTVQEIVLPSMDFVELPTEIQNLLRSSMSDVVNNVIESQGKDHDRDRDRRHSQSSNASSSKYRTVYCLHPELERMLLYAVSQPEHQSNKGGQKHLQKSHNHSFASSSTTLSSSIHSSMSRQDQQHLNRIYSTISTTAPNSIVSVNQCASALFKKWSSASANGCDESVTKGCMQLFKYALQRREPSLIPSLLCKRHGYPDATLFLRPASDVYLSEEYTGSCGAAIEIINAKMGKFLVIASNYHPNYRSSATHTAAIDSRKAPNNRREVMAVEQLLIEAGAQSTIKLEATARIAKHDDFSRTAGGTAPKLRSTNTSSFFDLPYNLGTINRKHHYLLDVKLSRDWENIVDACRGDASLAANVSIVVAHAICNTDSATVATSDSSPSLSLLLKGQAAVDRDTPMPLQRDAVTINSSQPIPAVQRLIYLPPGQPGASTEKLRPAAWIQFLKSRPWLPATVVSEVKTDGGAILVMKPSEVRLDSKSDADLSIPLAALPSSTLSLLLTMPGEIKSEFAFGTIKPRPPIERLIEIIKSSTPVNGQRNNELFYLQEICDLGLYLELKSIWKAISSAHVDGTLSREDKNNILSSLSKYPDAFVFPHPTASRCVYTLQRCVSTQQNSPESTNALCAIEYLLDVKDAEYRSILPSSMLTSSAPQTTLDQFLNSVSNFSAHIRSTLHLRVAFTTCLASNIMYEYSRLGRRVSGNIRSIVEIKEEDYGTLLSKCRQKLPGLKILCGPGPGPKGFSTQWRSAFKTDGLSEKSSIMPVVIDDQQSSGVVGSGFAKSSMLRVSHGYQPIMTLSPFVAKEHISYQDLNEQNNVLLKILDIPRISDNKMFSLRTKYSGVSQFLENETDRLHAVVLLLHLLSRKTPSAGIVDTTSSDKMHRLKAIKVIRYTSIELHFKTPKMEAAEVTNKHSVWGPPKLLIEGEKELYSGSLLLAGDLIDYVADLEEMLVLSLAETSMNLNTKDARRALKLLSHLESNVSFLKIFDRDFKSLLNFGDTVDVKSGGRSESRDDAVDENDGGDNIETKLYEIISKLRPTGTVAKSSKKRSLEDMVNKKDGDGRDGINLGSDDKDERRDAKVVKIETDEKKSIEEVVAIGRGSGRGVSLVPAWMSDSSTSLDKKSLSEDTTSQLTGDMDIIDSSDRKPKSKASLDVGDSWDTWEPPEAKMAGRGRGISLLPAWMTNKQANGGADMTVGNPPPPFVADGEQTANDVETIETMESKVESMSGGGRGRGISLLPAWMTSGVSDAQAPITATIAFDEAPTNTSSTELDQAELEDFLENCMTESAEQVKAKQEQLSKANKRKLDVLIEKERTEKKLAIEEAERQKKEEEKKKTIAEIVTEGKDGFSTETSQIVKMMLSTLISKGHCIAAEEMNALVSCNILKDAICSHIDKSAIDKVRYRKEAKQIIEIIKGLSTAYSFGGASESASSGGGVKKQKPKYGPG